MLENFQSWINYFQFSINDENLKFIIIIRKKKIQELIIFFAANRITRVSSCFAYWHYHDETYGINVVSADDCDRFYRMIKGCYEASTSNCTARDLIPTSSSMQSTVIPAYIMQIFEVDKSIVKNRNGSFAECIIKLTQNGALIRFKGKDFSLNLVYLLISFYIFAKF